MAAVRRHRDFCFHRDTDLSPSAFLSRTTLALSLSSLLALMAVGRAYALEEDRDVPRMVSFGGSCANCELSGRKLTGARFMGANFAGAALVGSDLRGASFFGSNFSGAEMDHAVGLTQGQLRGACGDEATTLPPGIRLRRCN